MDHRALHSSKQQLQLSEPRIKREEIIRELRREASVLRDNGESAAEFWLAEQYEMTANLLN
ncbi:MAG: hypothetical protein ACPGF7_06710 [Pontibacterium sp.]